MFSNVLQILFQFVCFVFSGFFLFSLFFVSFCFLNYDFGKAEVFNFELSFPRLFPLVLAFCNLFKKYVYPGVICFLLEVHWF